MKGGTTFYFVTDGIGLALEQARRAAGQRKVLIGGGPDIVRQYLEAGLVDEFELHVVPLVLGHGKRLFEGIGTTLLEQVRVVPGPRVTRIRYRSVEPARSSNAPSSRFQPQPG
jgi:dihydrofolate reductase